MTQVQLFAIFVALFAYADADGAPPADTGPTKGSPSGLDWPSAFSADSSAKMTLSEWNALVQEVKSLPGAIVNDEGPMLTTVNVGAPNDPSFYLFTQPAHPAHPAYLKASPSTSESETALVAGYAGSRSEFETFVRSFLEHLRRSQ